MTNQPARGVPIRLRLALLGLVLGLPGTADAGGPVRGPELVMLPAGTVVGADAPSGWSDLVIKSVTYLESGELESLPSVAKSTATLFRTVILADVRRAEGTSGPYELQRLGLGVCVPVGGNDTVVRAGGSGNRLGFIERQVLDRAESELGKGRILASAPGFVLFGSPTMQKLGTRHRPVWVFYAFLVDAKSGTLRTLVWSIDAGKDPRMHPSTALTLLPPRLVDACGLDVLADRWVATVPVSWSFAMRSTPAGRRLSIPEDLAKWVNQPRAIQADPTGFSKRLRASLPSEPDLSEFRSSGPASSLAAGSR